MSLPVGFVNKIAHCLQDEELDIYTLTIYTVDNGDLNYFCPKDRERVKKIFKVLTQDTRKHAELLRLILEIGGAS